MRIALRITTLIAFAVGIFLTLAPQTARADDPCAQGSSQIEQTSQEAATDPCHMAQVYDFGGAMQIIAGAVYTATAITCGVACAMCKGTVTAVSCPSLISACQVLAYVAMGVDIGGSVATAIYSGVVLHNIESSLMSLGTTIAGLAMSAGSMPQSTSCGAEGNSNQQSQRITSCEQAWLMPAIQAALRFANAGISFYQASEQRKHKQQVMDQNRTRHADERSLAGGGGGGTSTTPPTTPGTPTVTTGDTSAPTATTTAPPSAISHAMAEMRPRIQDGIDAYERSTGNSFQDLVNRLASGTSPMQAMADLTNGQLNSAQLSAMSEIDKKAPDMLRDIDSGAFASQNKQLASWGSDGAKRAPAAKSGMPDIAALLAGIMPQPKKDGEQGAKGPGTVGFGAKGPAANSEGLHAPSRSIFEVVSGRYLLVTKRVLEGGPATPAATGTQGLVPANPYLKN